MSAREKTTRPLGGQGTGSRREHEEPAAGEEAYSAPPTVDNRPDWQVAEEQLLAWDRRFGATPGTACTILYHRKTLKPPPPPKPGSMAVVDRAQRYLAKLPPSIQGSDGRGALFAACSALVRGFALSVEEALPLLQRFNDRAEPPWSEKQLLARLENAFKTGKKPMGYLLNGGSR